MHFLITLVFIYAFDFNLIQAQNSSDKSNERCPEGYFLHTDELCYPKVRKPCPFANQSTTTTTTTVIPVISTTTHRPFRIKHLDCPEGSLMLQHKCRKILCSLGEYYRGTCLQAVCPQGLVWRRRKCQKPAYLKTIIEIENEISNEVNEKPIAVATKNVNQVVYHTSSTATTATTTMTTTHKPFNTSQATLSQIRHMHQRKYSTTPNTSTTTEKNDLQNFPNTDVCCKIYTPRICKLYSNKWLCFNRKYQRCDGRVCQSAVVYLEPPAIKYEPPVLIMPPNPKMLDCINDNCHNNSAAVDCSGCANLEAKNCSPHCYRYICPNNTCTFMDLQEYCNIYSGQDGCLPTDGCLWKWCSTLN